MKSLAADQIRFARILLNLGYSYLHSTSSENLEDEEEGGREKEENNQLYNVQKKKFEECKGVPKKFNKNMEVQFDENIRDNMEVSLEFNEKFDKQYIEKIKNGSQTKQEVKQEMIPKFDSKTQKDSLKNICLEIIEEKHKIGIDQKHKCFTNSQLYCEDVCDTDLQKQPLKNMFIKLVNQNHSIKTNLSKSNKKTLLELKRLLLLVYGKQNLQSLKRYEESNVRAILQQELDKKVQKELKEKQNMSKGDMEIELILEIKSNLEFLTKLDRKIQKEFCREKQKMSEGDVEVGMEIHVISDYEEELDRKVKEELSRSKSKNPKRDKDMGIEIQLKFNEKYPKEFDRDEKVNFQKYIKNELDKEMLLNIKEVSNKSANKKLNKMDKRNLFLRIKHIDSIIKHKLNETLHDNFEKQQQKIEDVKTTFNNEIKQPIINGELQYDVSKGKHEVEKRFKNEVNVDLEIKKKLNKKIKEEFREKQHKTIQTIDDLQKDVYKEIEQKCNGVVLEEFGKEKQDEDNRFTKKMQTDSNIQLELYEKVQGKFGKEKQNIVRYVQKDCNGKSLKYIDNTKNEEDLTFFKELHIDSTFRHFKLKENMKEEQNKFVVNVPEVFETNMDYKVHNNIQVVDASDEIQLDEENIKCTETISQGFQSKCNDNFQVKYNREELDIIQDTQQTFDRKLKQEVDLETKVRFNNEIQVQLVEEQKLKNKKLIESIHREIKQEVERLISVVVYEEQNSDKKIQQGLHNEAHTELKKQIQQEIQELKTKIEEFEKDQVYRLEKENIKQLGIILSSLLHVNFLNNVPILLMEDSLPMYERVEQLYNQYFSTMSKLRQQFNDKMIQTEFDSSIEQTFDINSPHNINGETQEEIQVDYEIQCDINKDIVKEEDNEEGEQLGFYCEKQGIEKVLQKKITEKTSQVKAEMEVFDKYLCKNVEMIEKSQKKLETRTQKGADEKKHEVFQGHIQSKFDYIDKKEKNHHFDIVINISNEIHQKIDGIIQQVAPRKVHIDFSNDIIKRCKEELQLYDKKTVQKFDEEVVQKIFEEILQEIIIKKIQGKVEEKMELEFDGEIQDDINEKIHLQLEFYKPKIEKDHQKNFENYNSKGYDTDIVETFMKHFLLNKSEKTQNLGLEIKNNFEEKLQEDLEREIQIKYEESDVRIDKLEEELDQEFDLKIEEKSGKEIDEECEIEIEAFKEETDEESEIDIETVEVESKVDISTFKEQIQEDSDGDIDEFEGTIQDDSEKEIYEESEEGSVLQVKLKKIEVESTTSIDNFISTDEYSSSGESSQIEEEYYFIKKELCSLNNKMSFTEEYEKKNDREFQLDFEKSQSLLRGKSSQDLNYFHPEMDVENIQDLDEIPLELKIKQEQFEEELHKTFKDFQKDFYKYLKLDYDKEQWLKVHAFNPELSQAFDEQQKIFYKLRGEFGEIKQEYKDFVQQQIFKELLRNCDEKQLLEIEKIPEKLADVLHINIDEDVHKEFAKLQHDCYELEPEFRYNIPLEFEENNLSQLLKEKSFNLFEKLHRIHKQKLCEFVDSKQWPEYCLYPSSLLDCLFEDPSEIKPNVLVITLYSIDVGYSIKITMNKNEPPLETFFNYSEDMILKYVEDEQLPPHLLDLLDKAEPTLFYCGCIIAEIHDRINGDPGALYRILLHPSNMSIQSDLNRIFSENSHINWSYERRLKLESMLLLVSHPAMCMDSSPIAGLAVNLQHEMLSCRSIHLNPLKQKYTISKIKALETNVPKKTIFFKKGLSNKEQKVSELLKDNAESDRIIHHILWKFDYRLESYNIIKLYTLAVIETQEHSLVLRTNSKMELSCMEMRFKINLKTNLLHMYINMILEILKKKISPNMFVVRTYKSTNKSVPRFFEGVPKLLDDNIYEPTYTDMSWLINKLFIRFDKTIIETRTSLNQACSSQKTGEIKINDYTQVNHKKKNSISNISSTKKLSGNTLLETPELEVRKMPIFVSYKPREKLIPLKVEPPVTKPVIVVNSSIKTKPTIPVDDFCELDSNFLSNKSSAFTQTNFCDEPSTTNPLYVVSLDDSPTNVGQEKFDSSSGIPQTSISDKKLLSSLSSPRAIKPLNRLTRLPLILFPVNAALNMSNLTNVVSSVSSTTDIVPSISSTVIVTSMPSSKPVLQSVSSPITVISSVPSHISEVSSTTSNVSTCTKCLLGSKNKFTLFVRKQLPINSHRTNIDDKLKLLNILLKSKRLKYSKENCDSAINYIDNIKHQPPTLCNAMKTPPGTLLTQLLNSQCVKKISVTTHMHKNGICLKSGKKPLDSKIMSRLTQKTHSVKQKDKNVETNKKWEKLDSFLMKNVYSCKILTNDDTVQEIKNNTSSRIDGYKGVKRKRSP